MGHMGPAGRCNSVVGGLRFWIDNAIIRIFRLVRPDDGYGIVKWLTPTPAIFSARDVVDK